MTEEIIVYEGKVEKFILSKEFQRVIAKEEPKIIKVSSANIVIEGKREPYWPTNCQGRRAHWYVQSDWDLTIPLANVRDVFFQSFKAEGVMNYHKEAVGLEAYIDGTILHYAIFTKNPDDLFKTIHDSKTNMEMQG